MINKNENSLLVTAEEAANWYTTLEDEDNVTQEDRQSFVNWLRRSPANIEEFMRVGAVHRHFSSIPATDLPSVQDLLREAQSDTSSNVVKIDTPTTHTEKETPDTSSSKPIVSIHVLSRIAATLLVATTLFVWLSNSYLGDFNWGDENQQTIQTALGEQRSVVLPDGSVVSLNTKSRLSIKYTQSIRLVELANGEAIFDVAKDAERPFRVQTSTATVEAIGTQFNVYQQAEKMVVTVVEGQVSVTKSEPQSQSVGNIQINENNVTPDKGIRLSQGNQIAVLSSGVITQKTAVDPRTATAWTKRKLVFENAPLSIVVLELNRYNLKQLNITDPDISARKISGVFKSNDPATFVAFLSQMGGLHVKAKLSGNGWSVSSKPLSQKKSKS